MIIIFKLANGDLVDRYPDNDHDSDRTLWSPDCGPRPIANRGGPMESPPGTYGIALRIRLTQSPYGVAL